MCDNDYDYDYDWDNHGANTDTNVIADSGSQAEVMRLPRRKRCGRRPDCLCGWVCRKGFKRLHMSCWPGLSRIGRKQRLLWCVSLGTPARGLANDGTPCRSNSNLQFNHIRMPDGPFFARLNIAILRG